MLMTPIIALAKGDDEFGKIGEFFDNLINFINGTLIPLTFAVALLFFLYGVVKFFILGGDNEDKRKEGTQLMIYSIIGFVLMVSIFGLVNIIVSGLGIDDGAESIEIPEVPTR